MEKIELLHITPKGKIIGRARGNVPIKSKVLLKRNMKVIGNVYDIFGPVGRPYVEIVPIKREHLKNLSISKGEEAIIEKKKNKRSMRAKNTYKKRFR